jgi:hypothetical protein
MAPGSKLGDYFASLVALPKNAVAKRPELREAETYLATQFNRRPSYRNAGGQGDH